MLNHNNMPGAGSVAETLEFMKKMWGGMGAPAMGIPSLSVDEINKKIADLKTVASWLELNMNMLRATIQTMEVQSATLSTLQAMGAILTPQPGAPEAATPSFGFPAWPPQAPKTPAASTGNAQKEPEPDIEEEDEDFPMPPETPAAAPEAANSSGADESGSAAAGAPPAPDFQAAMGNPNAWWNLLQDQFKQAVGNALADHNASQPEVKPKAQTKTKAKTGSAASAKPKAAAKPKARAKSSVVQSGDPKPASRKPRSS